MILKKEDIEAILPHRDEFLLLDEVDIDQGEGVGRYLVPSGYGKGHKVYYGESVFLGVLVAEMAAQATGVVVYCKNPKIRGKNKATLFSKIGEIVWLKTVRPGETLEIHLSSVRVVDLTRKNRGWIITSNADAKIDGEVIATVRGITAVVM